MSLTQKGRRVLQYLHVAYSEASEHTIHEITRNITNLFVLVRVISWIVLFG
jgi:hypothetical protein